MQKCQLCYETNAQRLPCGHFAHKECLGEIGTSCVVETCNGAPNPMDHVNVATCSVLLSRLLYLNWTDPKLELNYAKSEVVRLIEDTSGVDHRDRLRAAAESVAHLQTLVYGAQAETKFQKRNLQLLTAVEVLEKYLERAIPGDQSPKLAMFQLPVATARFCLFPEWFVQAWAQLMVCSPKSTLITVIVPHRHFQLNFQKLRGGIIAYRFICKLTLINTSPFTNVKVSGGSITIKLDQYSIIVKLPLLSEDFCHRATYLFITEHEDYLVVSFGYTSPAHRGCREMPIILILDSLVFMAA